MAAAENIEGKNFDRNLILAKVTLTVFEGKIKIVKIAFDNLEKTSRKIGKLSQQSLIDLPEDGKVKTKYGISADSN